MHKVRPSLTPGTVTGITLIVSIIAGFLLPIGGILKPAVPFVLGAMLFFNFLSLSFERERFLRTELLLFPLLAWLVLPPIAIFGGRALFPADVASGILLAVITPPAISAVVMASLMGGERELPIVNSVIYNLLSPLAYTLLAGVYLSAFNIHVPVRAIITEVGLVVSIPFALALIARRTRARDILIRAGSAYNPIAMMLVIVSSVSLAAPRIRALPPSMVIGMFLAVLFFTLIFYGAGLLLGKSPAHRRSFAVAVGQKNVGLGMMVAVNNFSALAAVPVMLYLICHHCINGILLITTRTNRHPGGRRSR